MKLNSYVYIIYLNVILIYINICIFVCLYQNNMLLTKTMILERIVVNVIPNQIPIYKIYHTVF